MSKPASHYLVQQISLSGLKLWIALLCALVPLSSYADLLYTKPQAATETQMDMLATFTSSFENCGVTLQIPTELNAEEIHIEYRQVDNATYKLAHPFTQYDGAHAATSIFGLEPDTTYQARISILSNGTLFYDEFIFETRDHFTVPKPVKTTTVNSTAELESALTNAISGEHIVLNEGEYSPFAIRDRQFENDNPLVIRGHYNSIRPHIKGPGTGTSPAIFVKNSSNIIFDYLEVSEGGDSSGGINFYIRASSRITVQNSVIREGGRYNVLIAKSNEYSGGVANAGKHLIQNNQIFDADYQNCTGSKIQYCDNRTRFGIVSQNFGGGEHIFRNNEVYGHYDNISACSEGSNDNISSNHNLFAFTGSSTQLNGHNIEVYGNNIYDASDDNIELDGICSNVRVYNNRLGATSNQISIAPALPGPFFIIYNRSNGELRESTIKMNTSAGSASEPTRNAFIYNNTFVRQNSGSLLNLYFDHPEHVVPIENINFMNNLFYSSQGGVATKAINGGPDSEHPTLDYNFWFNGEAASSFSWHGREYYSFTEFQSASEQESHGIYSDACIFDDGFTLGSSNPAKDRGIEIPGINDHFNDHAPDIGSNESI